MGNSLLGRLARRLALLAAVVATVLVLVISTTGRSGEGQVADNIGAAVVGTSSGR
jgi:hypothetical protein